MPEERKRQGFPRPVSCRFCRSRKLRCSREAPCSNCASRGIRCDLEDAAAKQGPSATEMQLLERIKKLESIVESHKAQRNEGAKEGAGSDDGVGEQLGGSDLPQQIDHLDNDVAWLESMYLGADRERIPSDKVIFRTCPINRIHEAQPFQPFTGFAYSKCLYLPQYAEAKILLEKFVEDVEYIHRVTYRPSLPSILDDVYASLNRQGQVKPGYVILILSIFASATCAWLKQDCERGLFSSAQEANRQAPFWAKAAQDVLDIAHKDVTPVSLEGIQGTIILVFVVGNLEGFSRRCRMLLYLAYLLARELGLHRVDHPSNANAANAIQAEMGRRVFWYLVACDWQFAARFNGAYEGVYFFHVRQMLTKKPLNVEDEDLFEGRPSIERPPSHPTSMSYPLQRLNISELSRLMADRKPLMMAHEIHDLSHDDIMDIDASLQRVINDAPAFFSMSIPEIIETFGLEPKKAAQIMHQGYMFHSMINGLRCKLHLPYFSRGFVDPVQAPSRDICLRAARSIIKCELDIEQPRLWIPTHTKFMGTRFKFMGFLIGVFIASIVLLMDLCHSKCAAQQEKRRGEIADAFRMLDEARSESETAAKFLDSLMHVLRKHKVSPPKRDARQSESAFGAAQGGEQLPTPASGEMDFGTSATSTYGANVDMSMPMASSDMLGSAEVNEMNMVPDDYANGEGFSSYFNELTQTLEQGINAGSFDWASILSGLNPPFS